MSVLKERDGLHAGKAAKSLTSSQILRYSYTARPSWISQRTSRKEEKISYGQIRNPFKGKKDEKNKKMSKRGKSPNFDF